MNNLENLVALIFLTSLMLYTQLILLFITSLVREGNSSNRFKTSLLKRNRIMYFASRITATDLVFL